MSTGTYQEDLDYGPHLKTLLTRETIYPNSKNWRTVPEEVPEEFRLAFQEAAELLTVSSKASAAMSRRLLQQVLRERYQIRSRALSAEIDDFIQLPGIPSDLTAAVDAIRHIGNFAAHPEKDLTTGFIVEVEPGEAEWSIDTLESLLDVAFVQPRRLQNRKLALNQKLTRLGKAPIKV
jgi:hypothetical protein